MRCTEYTCNSGHLGTHNAFPKFLKGKMMPRRSSDVASLKRQVARTQALLAVDANPAALARRIVQLRGQISKAMPSLVDHAISVLAGERKWTTAQVQLFNILLRRVLPEVTQHVGTITHQHKKLEELDRDELERIARGETSMIEGEVIDAEPSEPDLAEPGSSNSASNPTV